MRRFLTEVETMQVASLNHAHVLAACLQQGPNRCNGETSIFPTPKNEFHAISGRGLLAATPCSCVCTTRYLRREMLGCTTSVVPWTSDIRATDRLRKSIFLGNDPRASLSWALVQGLFEMGLK
jgi:hypothetical protein